MSKKEVDPNEGLAADAVLAEDLGDSDRSMLAAGTSDADREVTPVLALVLR